MQRHGRPCEKYLNRAYKQSTGHFKVGGVMKLGFPRKLSLFCFQKFQTGWVKNKRMDKASQTPSES